jgi:hypothetical protein
MQLLIIILLLLKLSPDGLALHLSRWPGHGHKGQNQLDFCLHLSSNNKDAFRSTSYVAWVSIIPPPPCCCRVPRLLEGRSQSPARGDFLTLFISSYMQNAVTSGGSCGYGSLDANSWPNGAIGSLSSTFPLLAQLPLQGCGVCIQVTCTDARVSQNILIEWIHHELLHHSLCEG